MSSLAFVVMPDHFHWLIELLCDDLAEVMRLVKGRSARLGNIYLDQTGSLWQNGYHDHALRRDEDLRVAARYLVANPLRAGLVKKLNESALGCGLAVKFRPEGGFWGMGLRLRSYSLLLVWVRWSGFSRELRGWQGLPSLLELAIPFLPQTD